MPTVNQEPVTGLGEIIRTTPTHGMQIFIPNVSSSY